MSQEITAPLLPPACAASPAGPLPLCGHSVRLRGVRVAADRMPTAGGLDDAQPLLPRTAVHYGSLERDE